MVATARQLTVLTTVLLRVVCMSTCHSYFVIVRVATSGPTNQGALDRAVRKSQNYTWRKPAPVLAGAVAAIRIGRDERRHHRETNSGVSRRFTAQRPRVRMSRRTDEYRIRSFPYRSNGRRGHFHRQRFAVCMFGNPATQNPRQPGDGGADHAASCGARCRPRSNGRAG